MICALRRAIRSAFRRLSPRLPSDRVFVVLAAKRTRLNHMLMIRSQRWLAAVMAAGYVLVALGIPLPVARLSGGANTVAQQLLAAKDRSQPFPCRDKACGCITASQCFSSCCCNTPAETLAWARAHNLEAGVITALQARVAEDARATPSVASCCGSAAPAPAASCCSATPEDTTPDACCLEDDTLDEPVSTHTIVLKAMQACGGMLGEWLSLADATMPLPTLPVVCRTERGERLLLPDEHAVSQGIAPELPPPRVA